MSSARPADPYCSNWDSVAKRTASSLWASRRRAPLETSPALRHGPGRSRLPVCPPNTRSQGWGPGSLASSDSRLGLTYHGQIPMNLAYSQRPTTTRMVPSSSTSSASMV
jgi:hypothetical protein